MDRIKNIIGTHSDFGLLVLRVVIGCIFVAHGIQKLQGIEGTAMFFDKIGIPMAIVMAWVVALAETVGGIAIIVGFAARFFALVLSIVMLVAIFYVKAGKPLVGGYELELSLLAGLIVTLLSGAGRFSIKRD